MGVPRAMVSVGVSAALCLVCACRSEPVTAPSGGTSGGSDTSGTTETGDLEGTTVSNPASCIRTADCGEDRPYCVAPYDPGAQVIGDPACVSSCVEAGDLARACVDDGGCCPGLQCNRVDGFCAGDTSSGADGSSSTSATGDDTTGSRNTTSTGSR